MPISQMRQCSHPGLHPDSLPRVRAEGGCPVGRREQPLRAPPSGQVLPHSCFSWVKAGARGAGTPRLCSQTSLPSSVPSPPPGQTLTLALTCLLLLPQLPLPSKARLSGATTREPATASAFPQNQRALSEHPITGPPASQDPLGSTGKAETPPPFCSRGNRGSEVTDMPRLPRQVPADSSPLIPGRPTPGASTAACPAPTQTGQPCSSLIAGAGEPSGVWGRCHHSEGAHATHPGGRWLPARGRARRSP